ncbi:MAG: hypothetical protein ACE14L_02150 [Terriglobales bacterium]
MHRTLCIVALALVFFIACAAGQQGASQPARPTQPQTGRDTTGGNEQSFSLAVAEQLLNELRDGLVSLNRRRTLQVFASGQMAGFQQLADDLALLLENYDNLRLRYHIVQVVTEADGQRGAAMVNLTLEATPRTLEPPRRRSTQLKFVFARNGKQWKILDVEPRNFFGAFSF